MKGKTKLTALLLLGVLIPTAIGIGVFCCANSAQAEDNLTLVISETSPNFGGASNEFVELYNYGNTEINLKETGIKLKLLNSDGIPTSKNINWTNTTIPAGRHFLFGAGTINSILFDATYTGTLLAQSGGVTITDRNNTFLDKLSWKDLPTNKSMERLAGNIDTNNESSFFLEDEPNPKNSTFVIENNEEDPQSNDDTVSDESRDESSSNTADLSDKCAATSSHVKINEIFPYPKSGNEFVEIKNTGESCVDVSGWKIMDEAGHKKEFPENSIMGPGEYFFLEGNLYLNNDSDTVYLLIGDGDTKNDALDSRHFEKAQKDFSYSFDGKEWQWTSTPTPNEENIITDTDSAEGAGDSNSGKVFFPNEKIYLNEILPNPKGEEEKEEFIEILNGENVPVDLFGWTIRDGSKTGKYVFKEHTEIGPEEYLAIYRPQFKIALNNSGDSVSLYNPKGELASSVSFDKSIENASYGFDGKGWRWSKYLTPGKENEFDSVPSVKITKPKHTYKDLYTDFSAKAKDKETKKLSYTWDFGDGKKSYLAKTSHKYLDTGKYTVTLTVGDDSQTVEKSFILAVKNYPRPDLEIVKIIPNPVGNDSDGEIVEIRNNSGKKIELQGWKIASGSDDKIYNHPINGEISLEPNETKTITREICKFSLNNKAGKIQLVMPDGKVTDVVEYQKEKIADDEAYAKIDGQWQWIAPEALQTDPPEENSAEKEQSSISEGSSEAKNKANNSNEGEILGATDENIPYYAPPQTGYTPEDEFIFFKIFGLLDYKLQNTNYCPINEFPKSLAYL